MYKYNVIHNYGVSGNNNHNIISDNEDDDEELDYLDDAMLDLDSIEASNLNEDSCEEE